MSAPENQCSRISSLNSRAPDNLLAIFVGCALPRRKFGVVFFGRTLRKVRPAVAAIAFLLWAWRVATPLLAGTFTNPIVSDGADPWVVYRDGYYYLTYTTGSNVQIHRATRLTGTNGIGTAPVTTVFSPLAPYNQEVWAPELHFLGNKAYLYYAADDGNNANHRMFVAESDTTGPDFSFVSKGKIFDTTTDRWAIDGTVLEANDGSLYLIWSGWPGT